MIGETERIERVQQACDDAAWLFAESGGEDGFVPVVIAIPAPPLTNAVSQVRNLWDTIDRPNLRIELLPNVNNPEFADLLVREAEVQGMRLGIAKRRGRHRA